MSAEIIPIQPEGDEWADLTFKVPPPRPRIEPGQYAARSATLRKFEAFKRLNLELGFDIFQGEPSRGVVIARLPMFIRYPGSRGLSPNSKLARLFHLLYHGTPPPRWGRLSLAALQNKLWRVLVADAEKDANDEPLPLALRYSVVAQVIERLA